MRFYEVFIAAIISVIFSFVCMTNVKEYPPKSWSNWCYSNSSFARLLEKHRMNSKLHGPIRVDRFHLISFYFYSAVSIITAVFFIIDLCTRFSITAFLGKSTIRTMAFCVLFSSVLYEAFLVVWWAIANTRTAEYKEEKRKTKELMQALKDSKKKRRKE